MDRAIHAGSGQGRAGTNNDSCIIGCVNFTRVIIPRMVKNITFSAEETLIQQAREVAQRHKTTLNQAFRLWLESYARQQDVERFNQLLDHLQGRLHSGGRRFSREEMNERR